MASFPGGYPAARRLDLVEDLHGYRVADPYRWLEDADSPQTRQWLAAEDELWAGYRAGLPRGDEFTARVRELLRVGSVGLPTWRGPTRFAMRRDPDQEHAVLYVADQGTVRRCRAGPDRPGRDRPDGPDDARRVAAGQRRPAARLPAVARRGRGVTAAGDGRRDGGTRRRAHRPVPVLRGGLAARRQGLLLHQAAAAGRGARGGGAVPPAGVPARGGDGAGDGRGGVRRGARQDHVLRCQRQQGRALADHLGVGRDRAA